MELGSAWAKLSSCRNVVALAGQPNVGKSTLFNRMTGEIARVGNFPGTTVEISVGLTRVNGEELCIIDLPGAYGLSASSEEERVAKKILLSGIPRVTVVIVDGTNIDRTLYLAIQVLEMFPRVVIALNKWDVLHKKGIHVNVEKLAKQLGAPVVPISALTGEGVRSLIREVINEMNRSPRKPIEIDYGPLEQYIREAESILDEIKNLPSVSKRWLAIAIIEGDEDVIDIIKKLDGVAFSKLCKILEKVRTSFGDKVVELMVKARYRFIERVVNECVVKVELRERVSAIDKVFLNPLAGSLASIGILTVVFFGVFSVNTGYPLTIVFRHLGLSQVSEYLESYSLSGLVGQAFSALSEFVHRVLLSISNEAIASFVAYGVIGGLGVVLSFLPLVFTIMVVLAALEDSGLGPRMASSLHAFFSKFGLSGRAVYPLLTAFGCNVPAVLASRAAIDPVERLEIAMGVAFVPCQARLVVLAAFVTYVFSGSPMLQAMSMLFVLLGGVLLYLITAKIVRMLKRESSPPELLLEIPPLHKPSLRVVWWNSWEQTKHFLRKAGVLIFSLSLVSWTLLHFGPTGFVGNDIKHSFAALMGLALSPLFSTIYGLNPDTAWRVGFAAIVGFFAKEGILAVFAQLGRGNLAAAMGMNPQQAFAALLFFMYYLPCLSTAAVIYQEVRSVKMTIITVIYMVTIALAISAITYLVLKVL